MALGKVSFTESYHNETKCNDIKHNDPQLEDAKIMIYTVYRDTKINEAQLQSSK
jgi:hypothetical protein